MKKLDEHRATSEQDYGPWLDAATLFESEDGRLLLLVEGGYQAPYDSRWYELASRPAALSELLGEEGGWADPSRDQSDDLVYWLGVQVRPINGLA